MSSPSPEDLARVGAAIERRAATDPRLYEVLKAEPRTALALTRYSIQLANHGDLAPAQDLIEAALLLQPEEPVIWYSFGMVQGAAGAPHDAIRSYRRSLELEPRQTQAWASLGFTLAETGDNEAAGDAYVRALGVDPTLASVRRDLGIVRLRQRRYDDAVVELRQARASFPSDPGLLANLAVALFQSGAVHEAAATYAQARALDPTLAGARENAAFVAFIDGLLTGGIDQGLAAYRIAAGVLTIDRAALFKTAIAYLVGQDWPDAVAALARAWLDLSPNDPEASFALQAATADAHVARAPRDYIVSFFDHFADTFDRKLVEELNYHVPETLADFLRLHVAGGLRILDLGCGTGLSGMPLKPLASYLAGVDLSPRMIDKARARQIYDALAVGDVVEHLAATTEPYDLIVAADLVIYFGALEALARAAEAALKPGGLLALSAETAPGSGWSLLPSGRFAHSLAYLDSLAAPHLRVRATKPTIVRFEGKANVPGVIYLYEKVD